MTFLAPAVLAGLGAVSAPIAIHLLNKMRVQVVKWGAMRFLLESMRKNERKLKMEDLILLLLRCLLIALLALAFARPVINPEGGGNGPATGGPFEAVLLVDQSASMGQSNGVQTRFELARASAEKALDDLGPGSQAALFLVTDRVNQVIPRPTANLALVRRTLDVTEPSDRTCDLLPAVRLAIDTLRPYTSSKKQVIIFTDNQLSTWKQLDAIKALLADSSDVQLRLIPLGEQGEDNLAITAIRPENMIPAVGQLFGCLVEVSNFSATPAKGVRVTLALDGDAPSDEAVIESIEPGQAQSVRLNVRFSQAGFHTLRASTPPDRLPVDNQRALAVQVIDQMKATIVEGTQPKSKQDRDGFFLANALMPVAVARRADYYMKVEAVPASWLDESDLSLQDMIFLANTSAITPGEAQKLQKYVEGGGALIIFPGQNTQPDNLNNSLKDLLPARLGALREPDKKGEFAMWQPGKYAHPVTTIWNEKKNGSLGTIRTSKYYPLTLLPAKNEEEAPHAIVNYTDGTPAIVERAVGKGHVVLFSSTPTSAWNNLPIHPDFVPLLKRIAGYVSRQQNAGNLALSPGSVFQQTVNSDLVGREFSVVRPDSKGEQRPAGKVELVNRDAVVRYRDTEMTGAYRLFINGADLPVAAFAVQMDPAESNLKTIPPDRLAGMSTDDKGATASGPAAQSTGGVRREFWALLVAIAAIVAVAEMALAHKFSLSK